MSDFKVDKIELNSAGIAQLLHSAELEKSLKSLADSKIGATPGVAAKTFNAGSRIVARISTTTEEARRDNLENNTLNKLIKS